MTKNKSVIFLKLLNFSSMEDFFFKSLLGKFSPLIVTFLFFKLGENQLCFRIFSRHELKISSFKNLPNFA
jgi:hypothetical protein